MVPSLPDPHSRSAAPGPLGVPWGARIYAQLKPNAAGLVRLQQLQAQVRERAPRARLISADRLHLTLIHFGKAVDAFARLTEVTGVDPEVFGRALGGYLTTTGAALPDSGFVLEPRALAGFGREGSTLTVEFDATPELEGVHDVLYGLLLEFLAACGVPEPAAYAAADPSLAYAAVLRPHVSILHGFRAFDGLLPALAPNLVLDQDLLQELGPLTLRAMPVLYRG